MSYRSEYGMDLSRSLIEANDLGLVNGHITLNGWRYDLAEIRGLFAPPFFSCDFRLEIRFNGRRIPANNCFWQAVQLDRSGSIDGISYDSTLVLAAGKRAAIQKIVLRNDSGKTQEVSVQYEFSGTLQFQKHWGFNFPAGDKSGAIALEQQYIVSRSEAGVIMLGSSQMLASEAKEIFSAGNMNIPVGGEAVLYTVLAAGKDDEAQQNMRMLLADTEKFISEAQREWEMRLAKLEKIMPQLSSDIPALEKLYKRSLLHLLLNEWNVPEWLLHPYYSTGGINGGCICSYLWNYGEPYRLWSMLDKKSSREQLLVYLKNDLAAGYAFYPDNGQMFGPHYPVNQEKVLLLAHAYVTQSCDTDFLLEKCNGKKVIEILVEQALLYDDLSQKAVLADYGNGNHHLELRGGRSYNGVLPDLNLRRCINYHIADKLCRICNYDPHIDLLRRADDLKELIEKDLFTEEHNWFAAIRSNGTRYLCYTMQMFKALGWEDWALSDKCKAALLQHLNEAEFIGQFGMHSLAKHDPAYDPSDVDNGGPGACISFAPAIVDRLYRDGENAMAWDIFRRLLWLGDTMPYWGDSQMADRMEYRRDTPLQNDIQGAALAQTVIFGIFGITVNDNFTVSVAPVLPPESKGMKLENITLAGKTFAIHAAETGFTVCYNKQSLTAEYGSTITI